MQIKKTDLISTGVRAGALRDFLREVFDRHDKDGIGPQVVRAFGKSALADLIAGEWLELDDCKVRETVKAHRLRMANFLKPLTRAQAADMLAGVLRRAETINSQPQDFMCRVEWLGVFGSYLTDTQELGDLDIAYAISTTQQHRDLVGSEGIWGETLRAAYVRACAIVGKKPARTPDYILGTSGKLQQLTVQFLRNRQGRLQLVDMSSNREVLAKTPVRTVLGTDQNWNQTGY